MKLKKIIQVLAAVLLTIAVSIGVTLAFLKSEVSEENIMTIGEVHIKLLEYQRVNTDEVGETAVVEQFENDKLLVPTVITDPSASEKFSYDVNYNSDGTSYVNWGSADNNIKADYKTPIWNPKNISNEMDKMVFVENTGDYDAYVRLYFAFEAGNYVRYERFREMVHLSLNNAKDTDNKPIWTWDWPEEAQYNKDNPKNWITDINGTRYFIATATYNKPLAPDSVTEISLSQIALDSLATNNEAAGFGSEYSVLVKAQAIQADGFTDVGATAALNEGFGSDIPFKNMKKLTFVDLPTALHYLNGENSEEKITKKVKNITFGLTEKYKDEVAGRKGVLVANRESVVDKKTGAITSYEADFTAYAYYVPNADGKNYDIYVLADNWEIYTPNDSSYLFNDMRELTKVDTSNLNVSETRNMEYMFHACPELSDLDVSRWDVSKVTNFQYFLRCAIDTNGDKTNDLFNDKLTSLDVSNWNTESATDMSSMFYCCRALAPLDVSDWNVSKTTDMSYMFYGCKALTSIDVKDWDVSNVTDMMYMFAECEGLTTIDLAGWDVSNVKKMGEMFWGCGRLTNLDLSTWKTINLTNIEKMFQGCGELTDLNISTWDVSKVTNMKQAFYSCKKLPSLDISQWDMSSATTMSYMFYACHNLVELKLPEECNPSNLTSMAAMFKDCHNLASLDLSGWNTSNVTTMHEMFVSCKALSSLKLPNDVSKVTTMQSMFEMCQKLVELDLSGWNTTNLVNTENMFSTCSRLKTIYVSEYWNMGKVTSSSSMFINCYDLVSGSSGKKYTNPQEVNATYANYEKGYLTDIKDKPANP